MPGTGVSVPRVLLIIPANAYLPLIYEKTSSREERNRHIRVRLCAYDNTYMLEHLVETV
jgi:hypothetical protein